MGEVNKQNVSNIIISTSIKLKSFVNKNVNILTESDCIFLLILLSQCLYAVYSNYGKDCGDHFNVYPYTIRNAMQNTEYATLAYTSVQLRNEICHNYGSTNMSKLWQYVFIDNIELLNDFLKYILSQADYKITLIKMNGGL